jgi:hypothetical protein
MRANSTKLSVFKRIASSGSNAMKKILLLRGVICSFDEGGTASDVLDVGIPAGIEPPVQSQTDKIDRATKSPASAII